MKVTIAIEIFSLVLSNILLYTPIVNAKSDPEEDPVDNADCSNTAQLMSSIAGATADSLSVSNIQELAIPFYITRGASEVYHILGCDILLGHAHHGTNRLVSFISVHIIMPCNHSV